MAHPAPLRIKLKAPSTKRTARILAVKGTRYAALTKAVASLSKGEAKPRRGK